MEAAWSPWCPRVSTHSIRSDGPDRREQEDNRHKRSPRASPDIDKEAHRAKVPRPTLKLVEEKLAQDGNTVRPVQGDGAQVEDSRDSDIAPQADEVDQDANQRVQPHSQDRGISALPDLVPHLGAGEHLVAGEGPDGAAAGLQGRDADKVHDDEGGHGEEDGRALAHHVVVDLHHGLLDGRGEDVLRWVVGCQIQGAHAER